VAATAPDPWRRHRDGGGDLPAGGDDVARLWLVETGGDHPELLEEIDGLRLADPVDAVRQVSRDPALDRRLDLADGRRLTALEVQDAYLDVVRRALDGAGCSDDATQQVVERWSSVLRRLATDPSSCAREVEWVAKLRLLEGMRTRDRIGWDDPRLAAMDIQWSDVRPERGLYHRLVAAGAVERLVTDEEIERAAHDPPTTRGRTSGALSCVGSPVRCGRRAGIRSFSMCPRTRPLRKVPLRDPLRGTRAHVGALLDACPDAQTLVERLAQG